MSLVLGTVQLGLDYGIANTIGKPEKKIANKILDQAKKSGYNLLDTAISYGDSEEIIGEYLRNHINSFSVITKIPSLNYIKSKYEFKKSLYKYYRQSIKNLGKKNIYGIMLHDSSDYQRYPDQVSDFFSFLQKEENIKQTGLSLYNLSLVDSLKRNYLFNIFQVPFNVLDQRFLSLIDKPQENQFGEKTFFIRSAYLQGIFFAQEESIKRRIPEALEYVKIIQKIAEQYKLSIEEICLGYIKFYLKENCHLVLGADNASHVEKNYNVWNSLSLKKTVVDKITKSITNVPERVINPYLWGSV